MQAFLAFTLSLDGLRAYRTEWAIHATAERLAGHLGVSVCRRH